MKKIAGWIAAAAATFWTVAASAQEQTPAPVIEGAVSPVWVGVFLALVLGLIVWFVIAMIRAESKRKTEQESA